MGSYELHPQRNARPNGRPVFFDHPEYLVQAFRKEYRSSHGEVYDDALAEAECMDFTPRFEGRCMNYIPVDLNSYLYGYEKDLAYYERELDLSDGRKWEQKAEKRARLIEKY